MAKRILVVEDNANVLMALQEILELYAGYEVTILPEGKHVLETISTIQPHLILMDIMLGDMDGRDLCKSIKSNTATAHIPVILISASNKFKSFSDYTFPPDDFIEKPFEMYDLIERVKTLC